MFVRFQADDIVPNQQETVTRAMFSNNVGNLIIVFNVKFPTHLSQSVFEELKKIDF